MGEFVDRPRGGANHLNLPIEDFIATATNGKAVRLVAKQVNENTFSLISYHARVNGYRSHVSFEGDTALVWWEKRFWWEKR